MRTIEEEAQQIYGDETSYFEQRAFKYGVEFAQRWITVKENPEQNIGLLLKYENGKICTGIFQFDSYIGDNEWVGSWGRVISWRYIDLK